MMVIEFCVCNYCGKQFDELDEDKLSFHLLSFHPEVKTLDIHIKFEQSELEKLIKAMKPIDDDWDVVNSIQDTNDDCEPEEFIEECEAECDWINYGDDLVRNPEYTEWIEWRRWRAKVAAYERIYGEISDEEWSARADDVMCDRCGAPV